MDFEFSTGYPLPGFRKFLSVFQGGIFYFKSNLRSFFNIVILILTPSEYLMRVVPYISSVLHVGAPKLSVPDRVKIIVEN